MYKKILFGTCMTEYCGNIFNFALNLAIENNARLIIHYGLGRLNLNEADAAKFLSDAEAKVAEAYVNKMNEKDFDNYAINVTDGDVVSEMTKLARHSGTDLVVMGTSTEAPLAMGESIKVGTLGATVVDTILWAPCPVLVIPPAMLPGLARG